jgi:hypothetical protein
MLAKIIIFIGSYFLLSLLAFFARKMQKRAQTDRSIRATFFCQLLVNLKQKSIFINFVQYINFKNIIFE